MVAGSGLDGSSSFVLYRCNVQSSVFSSMHSGHETIKCPGCGDEIIPDQVSIAYIDTW